MRALPTLTLFLIFSVCCLPAVPADVINVPLDQPTIQAGIDAAGKGDTVLIADGIYTGAGNQEIDFRGKAITVRSQGGAEACIVDGGNIYRGFLFQSAEAADSVLQGVTIRNCYSVGAIKGGAIYCRFASPSITDCTIIDCRSSYGGGLYAIYSEALISNCRFSGNSGDYGGAIYAIISSPTIAGCRFWGNSCTHKGGAIYSGGYITNCTISQNSSGSGAGIYSSSDFLTIKHCTITDNTASSTGGAIYCYDSTIIHISDSILWGNLPWEISGTGDPEVRFCDVRDGYPGTGNIDSDPLLVSQPDGVYFLSQVAAGQAADSPCLDAGSGLAAEKAQTVGIESVFMDMLSTRTDHGVDQGQLDLGSHQPVPESGPLFAELDFAPAFGNMPFITTFTSTLRHDHPSARRVAARIDIELANGATFGNWRFGFTNIFPGETYLASWNQPIPEVFSLFGLNTFNLEAEDITQAPYNQPPYPPSGDTDLDMARLVCSKVIHVPAEWPTIQEGINYGSDGDLVLVADGTYAGPGNKNLQLRGRAITVKSENGPENCIIDCENDGRGFYIHQGEGPDTVVDGLTIVNGNVAEFGGGILCSNAAPTIITCVITGNTAGWGGGISCELGSPRIKDCLVHGNTATNGGGGMQLSSGNARVTGCTISSNTSGDYGGGLSCTSHPHISECVITMNQAAGSGGGILCGGGCSAFIINCLITGNSAADGGAVRSSNSSPDLINCTVNGNSVTGSGGAISQNGTYPYPAVSDCILWGNLPDEVDGYVTISYSDVLGGHSGTGNINSIPIFVSGPRGDYYLSQVVAGQPVNSPCINTGSALAKSVCFFTSGGAQRMELRTTGTGMDLGIVDMGFHYPAP